MSGVGARARAVLGGPAARAGAVLVAAAAVSRVFWGPFGARGDGYDFRPLWLAGAAVRHHEPLWSVRAFAYPPLAAWASVPVSCLPFEVALVVHLVACVAALALACLLAVVVAAPPGRRGGAVAPGLLAVAAVVAAPATLRSLDLANASLLLPPVVLAVCWLVARERWHAATALLVASLVVKPLLLPLLALPLVRGRWRVAALWCALGGAATAVALAVEAASGSGGRSWVPVVAGLLRASHFTGRAAPLDTSLAGVARVHPAWALPLALARAVVAAGAVGVLVRWAAACRSCAPGSGAGADPSAGVVAAARADAVAATAAGTAAVGALVLAGPLGEVHYVLLLLPGALVALAGGDRWCRVLAGGGAVAYGAAAASGYHPSVQALLVLAQLLVVVACGRLALTRTPARGRGTRCEGVRW